MLFRSLTAGVIAGLVFSAATAHAHFLWLRTAKNTAGQPVVQALFSEEADVPEPELLKRLEGLQIWHRPATGDIKPLTVKTTPEVMEAEIPAGVDAQHPGVIISEKNFGVTGRGDVKFLLQYYAKLYPGEATAAQKLGVSPRLRLDIVPVMDGNTLTLHVTWEGQPVADSEVVVKGPGLKGDKVKTDAKGLVSVELAEAGLLEIRARHIENKSGEYETKAYTEVRHYTTLTLPWSGAEKKTAAK